MGLEFASVMPHGDALIPGLGSPENGDPALTKAMQDIAAAAGALKLESLVIATPHGLVMEEGHSVALSERVQGTLGHIGMSIPVDRELSVAVVNEAAGRGIPCIGISLEDSAPIPMDWGALIPAWFFAEAGSLPPVTVICPSREFGLDSLAALGEVIADLAEASERRVGLVASADNAHAHREEGPYGFHESAALFDKQLVELTEQSRWEDYLKFEEELLKTALPDSPWQLAILTGAFRRVAFRTEWLVYRCPSYFGMMCALMSRT